MQAGGSDHIDQGIEAKQFDFAAHEIGDTRLGNAKQLGASDWLCSVNPLQIRANVYISYR
jgi:hypothetical protein